MASEKKLKIQLIRSTIDYNKKIKATVRALGLTKLNKIKIHKDTPQIRGMINKVKFLLKVEEIQNNSNENTQ